MASNPSFPIATASVSWMDSSQALHLHVFSTDGYIVSERMIGDGWVDGTLSQPGSAVSATCWVDAAGGHIRVYCTNADATTEWCLDPGSTAWYLGSYSQ